MQNGKVGYHSPQAEAEGDRGTSVPAEKAFEAFIYLLKELLPVNSISIILFPRATPLLTVEYHLKGTFSAVVLALAL